MSDQAVKEIPSFEYAQASVDASVAKEVADLSTLAVRCASVAVSQSVAKEFAHLPTARRCA